eukprot:Opistho-2@4678
MASSKVLSRKLQALDYPRYDAYDPADDRQFRDMVIWLEDTKIRAYKIEQRGPLKNIGAVTWATALADYLGELKCPKHSFSTPAERIALCDWLLGYAIQLEYADEAGKYNGQQTVSEPSGAVGSVGPLVIDYASPEFHSELCKVAETLALPVVDVDTATLLKAVAFFVENKLLADAIEVAKIQSTDKSKMAINLERETAGIDTGDATLNKAVAILRLLHMAELRDLQTKINEAIVAVQAITANPKTDSSLGQTGR